MNAFFVRTFTYPLYELVTGRRVLGKVRQLEKTQWLTPERAAALQWEKLKALLEHAFKNVAFYRRRFDEAGITPNDINSFQDLVALPPLTRQDLRLHRDELIASNYPGSRLHLNATGGSTGEPTTFYNDRDDLDYRSAVVLRDYRWAGLQLGDTHAMLWGAAFDLSRYDSLKGRLTNFLLNRHVLQAFDMSEARLGLYLRELFRLKPRLLTGYTSTLDLLARYITHRGIELAPAGLRGVVSSAETLRPDQRAAIQHAFACPVFDRYGSREVGCIAHECEQHRLHINSENIYVEVLHGVQPAPPGAYGELALTALNNYGFPFIRYLIGDAGSLSRQACPCGRGLPVLAGLLGRLLDILVTPDGRFLPGEFFPHLFKEVTGIERFQVVQKAPDSILIRIQPGPEYHAASLDYVLAKTHQFMGEAVQLQVELVKEFALLPSGKLRSTVSEIKIDFSRLH
jgi:phenylacetate-CoA ligase